MPLLPTYDVIGLGVICWDFVCRVRRYPEADEKQELTELLQQGGGPAATATVTAARLGARAAICGLVGSDDFGDKCLSDLRREGVDTSLVQQAPGKTTQFAFCVAEEGTGRRAIFYHPGSAGDLDPATLNREALLDCRCLLLDGRHLQASICAARWAREARVPVVLDLEHYRPENAELLQICDYPVLPESYATEHTGLTDPLEAGQCLHHRLGRLVIITRGAAGAVAFSHGQTYHQPAFHVEPIVDTTGAGDVFHGAFAYGVALGYELEHNLRFAAAVAGLKCRALGGRTGIPNFGEAARFMNEAADSR